MDWNRLACFLSFSCISSNQFMYPFSLSFSYFHIISAQLMSFWRSLGLHDDEKLLDALRGRRVGYYGGNTPLDVALLRERFAALPSVVPSVDWPALVQKFPSFLSVDSSELKERVEELRDIFSEDEMALILEKCPAMLQLQPATIREKLAKLPDLFECTREQIFKAIISGRGKIFNRNLDTMRSKYLHLRKELSKDAVHGVIMTACDLLNVSTNTYDKNIQALRKCYPDAPQGMDGSHIFFSPDSLLYSTSSFCVFLYVCLHCFQPYTACVYACHHTAFICPS